MKTVRFSRRCDVPDVPGRRDRAPGDLADVSDPLAADLVRRGLAVVIRSWEAGPETRSRQDALIRLRDELARHEHA